MKEQEQVHLTTFNKILSKNHTRPSLLSPLWHAAGYSIGVASALVGVNSAMHLTEAVETVIGNHYNE
jgi:3-demethoxyubiquinol 3-hydroxylase